MDLFTLSFSTATNVVEAEPEPSSFPVNDETGGVSGGNACIVA